MSVVDITGLTVDFRGPRGPIRTVDGVDLSVAAGETVALLGESGSGKSVTLRALLRLLPRLGKPRAAASTSPARTSWPCPRASSPPTAAASCR